MLALFLVIPEARGALRVDVPAGCGSASEFETEVRRRLGDARVLDRTEVSIVPEGASLEQRLRVRVGGEERTVRDVDCRALFQASVVVTVAIALSEPRAVRSNEELPEPSSKERSPRTPAEATNGAPAFGASAGGLVSFGVAPKPVFGLELEGRADWERFGVALGARYFFPATELNADGRGVRIRAIGGHLSGRVQLTPWAEGRVGVVAYRLLGNGLGSVMTSDAGAWAAGPTLGLAITPLRGRIGWLSLGGEGFLDLLRSEFEIRNYGSVYSVPALGAVVYLRTGLRFF